MKKFSGKINGTEYTDKEEFLKQLETADFKSGIKVSYKEVDVPDEEEQPTKSTVEETEDFELADFNPDAVIEKFTDMSDFDKAVMNNLEDATQFIDQLTEDQDVETLTYLNNDLTIDQDEYEEMRHKNDDTVRTLNNRINTLNTEIDKYEHLIGERKNEIDSIYRKLDVLTKADHILDTGINYCKELKHVISEESKPDAEKNVEGNKKAESSELDVLEKLFRILF